MARTLAGMPIAFTCPRCKCSNTVPDSAVGLVACEFCLTKVNLLPPGSVLSNTLMESQAPSGQQATADEIRADLERAKEEMRQRPAAPPELVDRGVPAPPPKKPTRRVRTSLGIEDNFLADAAGAIMLGGAVVAGAAAVGAALDDSDWGWAAVAAAGFVAADLDHSPQLEGMERREPRDPEPLRDFRRFAQARRIDRHGAQLIALRKGGQSLSAEAEEDLCAAVRLATYLVPCLMDDQPKLAQAAWRELVQRFDLEPAYDLVLDLLVETDIVSTTLLGPVLRRWYWAAKKIGRVPSDMLPQQKKRRKRNNRPLPRQVKTRPAGGW